MAPQALWRSVRAKVLAGRVHAAEAEELAREAVRLIRTTDAPVMQADALLDLAEVLHRSARPEEARAVAAEAKGLYELKGNTAAAARAASLLDSSFVAPASPGLDRRATARRGVPPSRPSSLCW